MTNIQQVLAALQANRTQPQQTFPPVVGRAPPQQPLPGPTMGNHMMPGPYGAQAQQMAGGGLLGGPYQQQATQLAGLLGNQGQVPQFPVGHAPYTPGLFMPGFRPGVDTPIIGGGGRPNRQVRPY